MRNALHTAQLTRKLEKMTTADYHPRVVFFSGLCGAEHGIRITLHTVSLFEEITVPALQHNRRIHSSTCAFPREEKVKLRVTVKDRKQNIFKRLIFTHVHIPIENRIIPIRIRFYFIFFTVSTVE